jgi:transposase-like protein
MLIHLHKQATTTPKVRAAIQASTEPASALAARFGTTEQTIYKWKHRDTVHDRSHSPHRLQTTLTPAQEAVAVGCVRRCWCRSTTCSPWSASS